MKEGIKTNTQANNDEVFFLDKPDDKYDEETSLWSESPQGMFRNYSNAEFSNWEYNPSAGPPIDILMNFSIPHCAAIFSGSRF